MCKRFSGSKEDHFDRNSKFELAADLYWVGFVAFLESCANISLEGFSIKNVSMGDGVPLISMIAGNDIQNYPTKVDIFDVTLEDIVKIEDLESAIFDLGGPVELTVRNLTARNVHIKGALMGV